MYRSLLLFLLLNIVSIDAKSQHGFVLITSLYNEKEFKRVQEYITCLENNYAHNLIKEICVIYDTNKDNENNFIYNYLTSKKITIHIHAGRPTYTFCFNLANTHYLGEKIIIANADIYFNKTLKRLNNYDLTNKFIALTRWDVQRDGKIIPMPRKLIPVSQDVWIFQSPIRAFKNSEFELGTAGCDNAIAYWAWQSWFRVINPCLTIQACHLHLSRIRNYNPESPYPVHERMGINPTKI